MPASRSVYLDNAATSWPKPPEVLAAMARYLNEIGGNPGRSGHRLSIGAGRLVESTREAVAELFHANDPLRVVFGANVTEALNLALCGLLRSGDHVITSSMEHNSMMRPLRQLEKEGVELTVVACAPDGTLDVSQIEAAIQPNTRLIALLHASNVTGTLLPIAEAGRIARKHDLLMLVDSAATAGAVKIDMVRDNIDLLAFTGHKSLLGPTGTGGLVIGERVNVSAIRPLKYGGTGSHSSSEEQPNFLPDIFESGTLNVIGLAGLDAGIRWIQEHGVDAIAARHQEILSIFLAGLSEIPGMTLYGTRNPALQVDTIAFNIGGLSPSEAGFVLDDEFGIQTRIGLHCAPAAHRTIGTFPSGAIRFAPGIFTSNDDVHYALDAVRQLLKRSA